MHPILPETGLYILKKKSKIKKFNQENKDVRVNLPTRYVECEPNKLKFTIVYICENEIK